MAKKQTATLSETSDKPSRDNKMPHFKLSLKCKNQKQKEFVKQMKDPSKQICFGVGSAGTGKTYLSLGVALSLVKDPNLPYKKVVIFVPTCESTKELQIGYLKGQLQDKMEPYMANSRNVVERLLDDSGNADPKNTVLELVEKGFVEFELINFVKGKTFTDCICVLEEAEDLSKEDMLLILTRKGGESCKMFISGDDKQISRSDLRNRRERSGLRYAARILSDMETVSVTDFEPSDIVRDPLLTEIIKRFEENS